MTTRRFAFDSTYVMMPHHDRRNFVYIRVRSIHPGVTASDVQEATGFDLGELGKVPRTEPPTSDELRVPREQLNLIIRPKCIFDRST
jgi:hypothetical protein